VQYFLSKSDLKVLLDHSTKGYVLVLIIHPQPVLTSCK